MKYTKVKSNFIKDEIRKTKWCEHKYIDDLITIERYAQGQTFGWMTGYITSRLKSRYSEQWKIIWQEVNPKKYREIAEREKTEEEQMRKEEEGYRKEEQRKLERDFGEWKKIGGKF